MIKVLHYGISENKGGIETYLRKIWENIDKENFQFYFIDTNIGKPCYFDEFSNDGCIFFKITPRSKSIFHNINDLEELFYAEKFDIIHCHLNTLSYVAPIRIALKHGVKVIVHSRSSNAPESVITKILHNLNRLFYFKIENSRVLKLAVSNTAGNWLFGKKKPFTVINNGIDIEKFKFSIDRRIVLRNQLGLQGKLVVGHVGAFLHAKNHDYLIRVFNEFHAIRNDSILVLIGDGPQIQMIRSQVAHLELSNNVIFIGTGDNVPELLCAMDVFVFPSHYEGFPNALLEAQTSGLPCLMSSVITNEVIISKNCFTLSIDEKPSIWAQSLVEICDLISRIDRLNEYKQIEASGLSVNAEIEKLTSIYLNLTNVAEDMK